MCRPGRPVSNASRPAAAGFARAVSRQNYESDLWTRGFLGPPRGGMWEASSGGSTQ
jgi:hypothetical protein